MKSFTTHHFVTLENEVMPSAESYGQDDSENTGKILKISNSPFALAIHRSSFILPNDQI
ncbi:hypothetical protein LA303_11960 [Candidatus Sulfidibacterium hydrothermale]|uniref:hypothetical protein n=1 Tax=Candidatus Sulfidibacterium hydrothermale TaxID=2875962 RepID=UPI001F0B1B5C|nr:hypothetical protein [Candidatus Sulfidibacterium hydrothermale]UBM62101.1 hypothetical protein LA303_11960 [Candidatus Sulfidibacterium hydrothermale]